MVAVISAQSRLGKLRIIQNLLMCSTAHRFPFVGSSRTRGAAWRERRRPLKPASGACFKLHSRPVPAPSCTKRWTRRRTGTSLKPTEEQPLATSKRLSVCVVTRRCTADQHHAVSVRFWRRVLLLLMGSGCYAGSGTLSSLCSNKL